MSEFDFTGPPDPAYHEHALSQRDPEHAADPFRKALRYFRRHFRELGEGRHRVVFAGRNGRDVIKVPWNEAGMLPNERELVRDHWLGDPDRYARAWRDERYTKRFGVLIIRMERLNLRIPRYNRLPDWCGAVDGFQVGYNSKRQLVAYDWG